jgi:hypothetical protein
VINPALGPQIPGLTRVAIDSVQSSMMTGKFVVPLDSAAVATEAGADSGGKK